MDSAEKQQLVERYIAACNAFDVEAMLATLSADVLFHDFHDGQLTAQCSGREAFGKLSTQANAMFSECEQIITAMRETGDSLVVGIACHGTFAAGVATGSMFERAGLLEFSFDDERIRLLVSRA